MPSSPYPAMSSPPASDGARAGRSRFTYRQLAQLASYNTSNPLRVIAHIDLDAFYAQCEMVRLGVPEDQPLAVQQWQGLIAINYPARKFGIGRHCNVAEAKKLCPELIAQHVATWREGDDKWAYRNDADNNISTDKVSLDPYRLQSRKILALIKSSLPPGQLQKVEKAGIDEVFLDLSAHIHLVLLERFPELSEPPPYDDASENLPLPSTAALDWKADALVDLNEEEETLDPDWDDIAMLIGSEIVRDVRAAIRHELKYTCSGGIASNKLLSKLGSAFKKPNCQTVVRNRAVGIFLQDFKFTKMRNLGGKLGDQVVSTFGTESVKELLAVPLDQIKAKFGAETGAWIYNTIRGIDYSEVSSRTQIKSMLSAKSFRPSINTSQQAIRWLRIFVADIFTRLVEEGVVENKRRPRTIHLSVRHSGQARSKQVPIPHGLVLNETTLFDLAKDLFAQINSEGSIWPCYNISMSVGGFEEGIKNNMGIGAFLVKGDDAASLRDQHSPERATASEGPRKRPRAESETIQNFFGKRPHPEHAADASKLAQRSSNPGTPEPDSKLRIDAYTTAAPRSHSTAVAPGEREQGCLLQSGVDFMTCSKCSAHFDEAEALQSHQDWHMAKELQEADRVRPAFTERSLAASGSGITTASSASSKRGGRGGSKKLEQGQRKLKFG